MGDASQTDGGHVGPAPVVEGKVHRRRPRYRGTHPRSFREKYKELDPQKYPEEAAKLRSKGKTPAGTHVPVMVQEILDCLRLSPGETVVDATLGYGGHSTHLMQAVRPGGHLIALDVDPVELPKAQARLLSHSDSDQVRMSFHRSNFAGLGRVMGSEQLDGAQAILADLGLSSMQIDDPDRGFSWKTPGPLDMRMNRSHGRPASDWIAEATEGTLAGWFSDNADEPHARRLATAIVQERTMRPITTTQSLARVLDAALSKPGAGMPALTPDAREVSIRRVFQAIRIAVNDEFGALENFLRQIPGCLCAEGRVAILTFHSGEDRRVKRAFARGAADGVYSSVAEEVIRPNADEIRKNPRSASAKLRWAVRSLNP